MVAIAGIALLAIVVLVAGLTFGAQGSVAAPEVGEGSVGEGAFVSRALGMRLRFAVSLPKGYQEGGRYPVVYYLHGLPASPAAFRDIGYLRRSLDETGRQAILVAPQAARDGDLDPEYIDWGEGRNWETALARELPAYVDQTFRTIANRRGRALVGISAGGYGALLMGLHYPGVFSVVESWSGYTTPTDPDGTRTLDLGSPAANARASAHAFARILKERPDRQPAFLGFYVGSGDTRFRDDNVRFDRELRAASVPHLFRLYPGGHTQGLWSAHAAEWLDRGLARLAPASPAS